MSLKNNKTPNKNSYFTYEKMPDIRNRKKFIMIYIFQMLILALVLVFLWFISSSFWFGAIIGQSIVTFFAVFPFVYITKKSHVIREAYIKKYGDLAYQSIFYKFIFFAQPLSLISSYFPILLKTDYFLPKIINLPSHFMTSTLIDSVFIVLPIGILLYLIGFLLRRPTGGFDFDVNSYIYLIYPKKGKIVENGLYRYIRHPKYLGQIFVSTGLGILANNLVAICVAVIHFVPYLLMIKIEDEELTRRFGSDFIKYRKNIPALIPHLKNWGKFTKSLFELEK